jgi:hypothetical protein
VFDGYLSTHLLSTGPTGHFGQRLTGGRNFCFPAHGASCYDDTQDARQAEKHGAQRRQLLSHVTRHLGIGDHDAKNLARL